MLDISPVLLLSSGVIFLLVVARLNTSLFQPLLKHMDDRDISIKKDLEDAKSNGADVEGMLKDANNIIAKAKKEAASIREEAYTQAKSSADEKLANAKKDLEVQTSEFTKNLEDEAKVLKDTLVANVPKFNKSLKSKLSSI